MEMISLMMILLVQTMFRVTAGFQHASQQQFRPHSFQRIIRRQIKTVWIQRRSFTNYATFHSNDAPRVDVKGSYDFAKTLVTKVASTRTWDRLGPVFELATASILNDNDNCAKRKTCVDVGCDHGLLTLALASSGCFEKVFGTDVSPSALRDGALSNYDHLQSKVPRGVFAKISDVEFQIHDGILDLDSGGADVICLCGMGVNTMEQILFPKGPRSDSECNGTDSDILGRLDTKCLVVQPTNSRPRNMIQLYDLLQSAGWSILEERIAYVSSRWYITSSFTRSEERRNNNGWIESKAIIPGMMLAASVENDDNDIKGLRDVYQNYVEHHTDWLERDQQVNPLLDENDERWLNFCSNRLRNE